MIIRTKKRLLTNRELVAYIGLFITVRFKRPLMLTGHEVVKMTKVTPPDEAIEKRQEE